MDPQTGGAFSRVVAIRAAWVRWLIADTAIESRRRARRITRTFVTKLALKAWLSHTEDPGVTVRLQEKPNPTSGQTRFAHPDHDLGDFDVARVRCDGIGRPEAE